VCLVIQIRLLGVRRSLARDVDFFTATESSVVSKAFISMTEAVKEQDNDWQTRYRSFVAIGVHHDIRLCFCRRAAPAQAMATEPDAISGAVGPGHGQR
jgi:hypothetical protein